MFVGSLGIGLIGFATLASAQALKEIGGEIQANPLTLLMFLFPVSIFAGFNTAVLIISLWVWNILARIVRWIVESI
jgi:hypothetical protein